MAITKEQTINAGEAVVGVGGKGNTIHCWWECKLAHSLWKSVWRVLRKLKIVILLYHSWTNT
jgi:hypothetical protein